MSKLAFSILLLFLLLFSGTEILADCALPGTPTEELKRASIVFSGKVVGSETRKITDRASEDFGGEQLYVKLKTYRWWKGDGAEEVTLRTGTIFFPTTTKEFAEGFAFSNGESYLVYAFYYNGAYGAGGCTRTVQLGDAGKDLKELGAGYAPSPKPRTN